MRNRLLPALFLAPALVAHAQSLTSVVITPTNPTECDLLTFHCHGTMPQQANFTSFSPDFDADSLNLSLAATGGGGQMSNFNQAIPGLGPFAPGTYTVYVTFTLNGNLVGSNSQVITIGPGVNPDAGEGGSLSDACTGGPDIPLITLLGGTPDPGGTWLDPNSQIIQNGLFVPGQSPAGPYTYYFDVQEPCIDASQYVFITYADVNASAGLNSTVQTCAGYGAPVDLYDALGGTPDAGGTWTYNGNPHSATYDPTVDVCGAYIYTVPGFGTCPPATATITMQCVPPPNAGTVTAVNDTIYRCYNDTIELMQTLVQGEQNTGLWISPFGFGVGTYNDSINLALNGPGAYGYVVFSNFCPNDTSFIHVILLGDSIVGCTIGVPETEGNVARFDLLPNPAQDQVTVEVELARTGADQLLEILDVDGKAVRSQKLIFNGLLARQTIAVGDLAKGAYLVRVSGTEGRAVRRLMLR